jgi:hypothetical protein
MKKHIFVAILFVTNIVSAFCLLRMWWSKTIWEMEARSITEFAAKVWASNDYSKGRLVKLRLIIEEEPKGFVCKPTEFEGPFVVREWQGYKAPSFLFVSGENSPSIQTAQIMVASYNQRMAEYHEHPKQYEKDRAAEIEYWKKEVLGNKDVGGAPGAGRGK